MNEELQKALAELIEKSIAISGDALSFTQEQLPEVVRQLLLWRLAYSALVAFLGAMCFVALVIIPWRKWAASLEDYDTGASQCLILIAIPLFITGGLLTNLEWLQVWLAPKVYLLEYAANLIK